MLGSSEVPPPKKNNTDTARLIGYRDELLAGLIFDTWRTRCVGEIYI